MYVINQGPITCTPHSCGLSGNASVTVYSPGSAGDEKPIATISGPNTGITSPHGISLDANGNIYVLNLGPVTAFGGGHGLGARTSHAVGVPKAGSLELKGGREGILMFAPGSNGDVAPFASIAGPLTGLDNPGALAIGPAGN
jgi:hypothetical protein